MGVAGLTGLVEERGAFFTELRVRDTRLVIDGSSLYHRLCFASAADFRRGGDYGLFSAAVGDFFGSLRACRVSAFVVLDGGRGADDRKLPTLRGRAGERLRAAHGLSRGEGGGLVPLLTREAFVQALGRLGVPFVQCFAEADREIAGLANRWGCPVLSLDSDFCVFDLAAGYCPLSHFQWRSVRPGDGAQGPYVPARCFWVEKFCRHFSHPNSSLLPLFAAMSGNDYVDTAALEAFFGKVRWPRREGKHGRLRGLLRWLAQFSEPSEALDHVLTYLKKHQRQEMRALLCASMEDYTPSDVKLEDFFQNGRYECEAARKAGLPQWVLDALAKDPTVLRAEDDSIAYNEFLKWKEKKLQNEDFDLDAAHSFCQWQCSLQMALHLNQLLGTPLSEPDLSSLYTGTLVHRLYQELKSTPSVENLFSLSPKMTQLYQVLLNTVESAVSPDFFQKMTKTKSESCKKKKASSKKKKAIRCAIPETQHLCSVNRFASLGVDE
ncbi:single-strand DNA endonuclease ASTE1 isoform X3 [Opisthocomus hoazin]|uniref:single-strand DNA endonuclease ASTE1 isoform X3 n=1 Tax=Opisthocomus hoazin TaxID=30419 RepID=UPI003F5355B1